MIRVHVFVEGQTEETFLREMLIPYFSTMTIFLSAIIVRTSTTGKGGVVRYAQIKPQIQRKCLEDRGAYVDLFRLPNDFPGQAQATRFGTPWIKLLTSKTTCSTILPNRTSFHFWLFTNLKVYFLVIRKRFRDGLTTRSFVTWPNNAQTSNHQSISTTEQKLPLKAHHEVMPRLCQTGARNCDRHRYRT